MVSARAATGLRVVALSVALIGVAWDAAAAWWLAFPGPSGEWAALAVPAAWFVGVPCGVLALLVLWLSGSSHSRLRGVAQLAAVLAGLVPVLMSLLASRG